MVLDWMRGVLALVDEEGDQMVIPSIVAVRTSLVFSPSRILEEWSITPKTDQILWLVVVEDLVLVG